MKPREKKPSRVFRIINKETGESVGSYSRAYCDEFDFDSVSQARNANCHGEFQDNEKYNIAEYEVTYKLVNANVPDPDRVIEKPLSEDEKLLNEIIADDISRSFKNHKGKD